MALEVVWRNPIPRPRTVNKFELVELDQDMSTYIFHSEDAEVVFRIDYRRIGRPLAEIRRVGGA
jgi:hypothetical protein